MMQVCKKCSSPNVKHSQFLKYYDTYSCLDCTYFTYKLIDDCCRDPFKIIVIDSGYSVGPRLYEQCKNCGGVVNRNKPFSYKKYGNQIRDEMCEERMKEHEEERRIEHQTLQNDKDNWVRYNSFWYKYNRYLSSPEWKQKRQLAFQRDNNTCQHCFLHVAEEVHHIRYNNVFDEALDDLLSVCSNCHKKIHESSIKDLISSIESKHP